MTEGRESLLQQLAANSKAWREPYAEQLQCHYPAGMQVDT